MTQEIHDPFFAKNKLESRSNLTWQISSYFRTLGPSYKNRKTTKSHPKVFTGCRRVLYCLKFLMMIFSLLGHMLIYENRPWKINFFFCQFFHEF